MTSIVKLDYDNITVKDVQLIFHHRGWLLKYFGIVDIGAYETNKGYHVAVVIEADLEPRDVLLLQVLMGSDIQRDIYNFIRKYNGENIEDWNKLYTKKWIILGTNPRKTSVERECPDLFMRIKDELDAAKDWRGRI